MPAIVVAFFVATKPKKKENYYLAKTLFELPITFNEDKSS